LEESDVGLSTDFMETNYRKDLKFLDHRSILYETFIKEEYSYANYVKQQAMKRTENSMKTTITCPKNNDHKYCYEKGMCV
jgi:hypothetical protein